eukprot:Polyplicarium_translucidae@DN1764_c0_g1_i1.p1
MPGEKGPRLVQWDAETTETFLKACKDGLDFKTCKNLERRARSGTGTEAYLMKADSCGPDCSGQATDGQCSHHGPRYVFRKTDDDNIGAVLDESITDARLREVLASVAERSHHVYQRIVKSGKNENMVLNTSESSRIKREVLQEVLSREILKAAATRAKLSHVRSSHDGGLLANPAGYRDGPLSTLHNVTIASLMNTGRAVQEGLLGEEMRNSVLSECQLVEFEGHLSEVAPSTSHRPTFRGDRICWLGPENLHPERQKGLLGLCDTLMALPYELNKKCNLLLQAASVFEISCFTGGGTHHAMHFDSGYSETSNTGRKVAAVYFPNELPWKEEDGGQLRVHAAVSKGAQMRDADGDVEKQRESMCLDPVGDRLVLLWCRSVPWEVLPTHRKRFALTMWFGGPAGPGD